MNLFSRVEPKNNENAFKLLNLVTTKQLQPEGETFELFLQFLVREFQLIGVDFE